MTRYSGCHGVGRLPAFWDQAACSGEGDSPSKSCGQVRAVLADCALVLLLPQDSTTVTRRQAVSHPPDPESLRANRAGAGLLVRQPGEPGVRADAPGGAGSAPGCCWSF
ncbi:hypothetical protein GCM10010377_73240 [Streptomyces viridiviolaceus]|nr:hypothetical protein GCM10010377_73240 [Streptomyces viridiviolaceus]